MISQKIKWEKALPYLVLSGLTLFFCWLFCLQYGVFGAKVDWISQHSVLPDYFRRQFYETGQLFPEFAPNIGGGQNIYNFSYYGLYSPIVLLSYLLPFVKMSDYIMFACMGSLLAGVLLFYRWLRGRGFGQGICFGAALVFLLAGPVIFHSYSQVMFVDYLPFLCMGLIGVDRYFVKKRSDVLILGTFLMILTSFYFSIGGILVLCLYGIHRYLQEEEAKENVFRFWNLCKAAIKFLVPILAAVMMSGVLLVPTVMALFGRAGGGGAYDILSLLIPEPSFLRIAYHPYGIGVTGFAVTVLLAGCISKRWSDRVLHLGCLLVLTVPLFSFLLNGGLYLRDKVMIPFLPLLCYMLATYVARIKEKKLSVWVGVIPYLCTILLTLIDKQVNATDYPILLLMDGVIMLAAFFLYVWKQQTWQLLTLPVIFLLLFGVCFHRESKNMLDYESYAKLTNPDIGNVIEDLTGADTGFYRIEQQGSDTENGANLNRIWDMGQYSSSFYSSTYNEDYMKFRQDTFLLNQPFRNRLMQTEAYNPIFQKLMGVRYVVSASNVSGYTAYREAGDVTVWRREGVAPMIYGTGHTMDRAAFDRLEFPYCQLAFSDYVVVESGQADEKQTTAEWADGVRKAELKIPHEKKGKTTSKVKVPLQIQEGEKLLFVKFNIKNHGSKDVWVRLGKVKNKLSAKSSIYYNENETFVYALDLEPGQKELAVELGPGDYELTDLECYYAKADLSDTRLYESAFTVDREVTKGNYISGTIEQKRAGWLVTSIPYDENFVITLDGQRMECERVNTAFLGCRIPEGAHLVEIRYHAPGAFAGKVLSLLGAGLFVLIFVADSARKRQMGLTNRNI